MNHLPLERMSLHRVRKFHQHAFAMAEAIIAMGLVSLTLSGLFAMNGQLLGLLRQGKESIYATQLIQERIDTIRTGLWNEVTDPARIATTILGAPAVTSTNFPGATETVTIEPLTATGTNGQCTRTPAGVVTTSGSALTTQKSIKATVTVQWTTKNRVRSRSAVTILSNGGI